MARMRIASAILRGSTPELEIERSLEVIALTAEENRQF
jgi:hypothetical protein